MKASDKPVISKKWWTKEKPGEIKGSELEKALAACEKALEDAKKNKDSDSIDAALGALDDLSEAAESTSKECEKKKLKDVVSVLDKFDKLIDSERADLEKLQEALEKESDDSDGEDESDDDAKGVLKEEYRARMIKLLRSGEQLQFSMGLDKQAPENSCLVLCKSGKPERLYKILKGTGDFSKRLMTFGTITGDGKILDLKLSDAAKEPAQIAKTAKLYLRSNRDLKFRKIRVHVAGEIFEEDMEDQEAPAVAGGAGAGDLQARIRKAEVADRAWQKARGSISDQIAQVQRELNAFEDPDAASVHDGLSSLVDKLPDPGFITLQQSVDANAFAKNLEKTRARLRELQQLVAQGGALQTVDGNPFVKTNIVGTLNEALSSITKELQIA